MRKSIGTKMNDLDLRLEVYQGRCHCQPLRDICDVECLGNRQRSRLRSKEPANQQEMAYTGYHMVT